MKKIIRLFIVSIAASLADLPSIVSAHDIITPLSSVPAAALEGNFGLPIRFDSPGGGTPAYVEDRSTNFETVYRGSFLLHPNNIDFASPSRQQIFVAFSQTSPSCSAALVGFALCRNIVGACDEAAQGAAACGLPFYPVFALYIVRRANTVEYGIQAWLWGNLGGWTAINGPNITFGSLDEIDPSNVNRVCFEWEAGSPGATRFDVIEGPNPGPCPSSGSYAGVSTVFNTSNYAIEIVRLGGVANHEPFNGDIGTVTGVDEMYFDSFESFRTLSP